jgi:hypothetical protein
MWLQLGMMNAHMSQGIKNLGIRLQAHRCHNIEASTRSRTRQGKQNYFLQSTIRKCVQGSPKTWR